MTNSFPIARAACGALLLFAVASLPVKPAIAAPATQMPSPSGMIKYHLTSSGAASVSSDMKWTWDKSGQLFRQDLNGHLSGGLSGSNVNTTSWTISDGHSVYTGIPSGLPGQAKRKVAIKMTLPPGFMARMTKMGKDIAASSHNRVVGHSAILGKPCDIYAANSKSSAGMTQSKVWVWHNLPLRTETTMTIKAGGKSQVLKTTMVATQVDTSFKPSPSLFRVPGGYQVQTMAQFEKQMPR